MELDMVKAKFMGKDKSGKHLLLIEHCFALTLSG
ncbi:hypothetical protein DEFFOIHO_00120 [Enterobacteria phage Cognac]|nr:hypothetical protein DEFFOIHO_00120 [Enterobacteria phage Cognac]